MVLGRAGSLSEVQSVDVVLGCAGGTAHRKWREMVDALRRLGGLRLHYDGSLRVVGVCTGHTGIVTNCAWAPDGCTFATRSCGDGMTRVWRAADWSCLCTLTGETLNASPQGDTYGDVTACAWSPDGSTLVTTFFGPPFKVQARVWSAADWSCVQTLSLASLGYVGQRCLAWAPDGTTLVIVSGGNGEDDDNGVVQVWSAGDWSCLRVFVTGHTDVVTACVWAPDGSTIVTTSEDTTVRVWSAVDWSCLRTLTGHTESVKECAWAPDGSTLVTTALDETPRVWSAADWSCLATLITGHAFDPMNVIVEYEYAHEYVLVTGARWAPDGAVLATPSSDGTTAVWSATDWSCVCTLAGHTDDVSAGAWARDGSVLVTASSDQTVRVWSAADWSCMRTLDNPWPTNKCSALACAWAPDGSTLITTSGNLARVWSDV